MGGRVLLYGPSSLNLFRSKERYMCVMANPPIPFPRLAPFDPDAPIKFASLQIGRSRLVIDMRGPEPKYRDDQADVIPIKTQPNKGRKKAGSPRSAAPANLETSLFVRGSTTATSREGATVPAKRKAEAKSEQTTIGKHRKKRK